jgi:hypothetical protein
MHRGSDAQTVAEAARERFTAYGENLLLRSNDVARHISGAKMRAGFHQANHDGRSCAAISHSFRQPCSQPWLGSTPDLIRG